ncbi:MAG: hypothetical protein NC548_11115 [Lachnospiraceae bacterium]|nr:hypothetical protein [Lachnospiraceae bacterium]
MKLRSVFASLFTLLLVVTIIVIFMLYGGDMTRLLRRLSADSTTAETIECVVTNAYSGWSGIRPDLHVTVKAERDTLDFNDIKLYNKCKDSIGESIVLHMKWWDKDGVHISYSIQSIEMQGEGE